MENRGIVFSRDKLLETCLGLYYDGGTRTVDVHVQTLRQKLGNTAARLRRFGALDIALENRHERRKYSAIC